MTLLTLRDGSRPKVEPLLTTQNGEALLSIVRYMMPSPDDTGTRGDDLDHYQCLIPHPFEGSGLRVHQLGDAGGIHWRALCSYGDPSGRFVPGQQSMESRHSTIILILMSLYDDLSPEQRRHCQCSEQTARLSRRASGGRCLQAGFGIQRFRSGGGSGSGDIGTEPDRRAWWRR